MESLISLFLPVLRQVASNLAGSEFATDAEADVKNVEGLLSKHLKAADAELVAWWTAIRHPEATAANPATPDEPAPPSA